MTPPTIPGLLAAAGVAHVAYDGWPGSGVWLTAAGQLVASFDVLKAAQAGDPRYRGWHAHHVVEVQDLRRLGVERLFPAPGAQLCVLLPAAAHVGRVNSVLRAGNPAGAAPRPRAFLAAYRDAYALVGDYCGGGEAKVCGELVSLATAVFRAAGLV